MSFGIISRIVLHWRRRKERQRSFGIHFIMAQLEFLNHKGTRRIWTCLIGMWRRGPWWVFKMIWLGRNNTPCRSREPERTIGYHIKRRRGVRWRRRRSRCLLLAYHWMWIWSIWIFIEQWIIIMRRVVLLRASHWWWTDGIWDWNEGLVAYETSAELTVGIG